MLKRKREASPILLVVAGIDSAAENSPRKRDKFSAGDTIAAVGAVAALAAVAATLIVGYQGSKVADATRQDTLEAQRASQFSTALDQVASAVPERQLGGVLSLGFLIKTDSQTYLDRSCGVLRGVINAKKATPRPVDPGARAARDEPIIASLNIIGTQCPSDPPAYFSELDLSGANLAGVSLRGLKLVGVNLSGANLRGSDLSKATLLNGTLNDAVISKANLTEASLMRVEASGIDASESDFSSAILVEGKFKDANFSDSILVNVNASGGANFFRARFVGADLKGANFSNATLVGADFTSTELSGAKFDGANVNQAKGL